MPTSIAIPGFDLPIPPEHTLESTSRAEASAAPSIDLPTLVQTHAALLFRVAFSILRSPSEAEDVVQDTFLRVLKKQAQLSSIQDMRVWLVRIAWNLALDRRRRIRPDQIDDRFARELASLTVPVDETLAAAAQTAIILREIDRLPKHERQVILLSASEELTTPEIAHILGRTESATRALLHRARCRLRERLEKHAARPAPNSLRRSHQ